MHPVNQKIPARPWQPPHLRTIEQALPGPSSSPAHHARTLSIHGLPAVAVVCTDAGGWARSNVDHLGLSWDWMDYQVRTRTTCASPWTIAYRQVLCLILTSILPFRCFRPSIFLSPSRGSGYPPNYIRTSIPCSLHYITYPSEYQIMFFSYLCRLPTPPIKRTAPNQSCSTVSQTPQEHSKPEVTPLTELLW